MKKLFLILLFCFSFSAFADTIHMRIGTIRNVTYAVMLRPIHLIKKFLQNNT